MTESLIVAREQILQRIRGEYLEMPGLRLTCAQAARLWAIEAPVCVQLLESLSAERFLYRRNDGTYARVSEGAPVFPRQRMLKAPAAASALARRYPRQPL